MDTKNEQNPEAAEELESQAGQIRWQMEQQQRDRLQAEQDQQQDLTQGMETGTHEARIHGIKWGPSYRIKPSATNSDLGSSEENKDSSAKS